MAHSRPAPPGGRLPRAAGPEAGQGRGHRRGPGLHHRAAGAGLPRPGRGAGRPGPAHRPAVLRMDGRGPDARPVRHGPGFAQFGHDPGGHRHRHPHPPLLGGLHVGGGGLCPLLLLPEPVRLLHAHAGAGLVAAAPVRGLGRGRPLQLPPDRLLLRHRGGFGGRAQGLPVQPGGRPGHDHGDDGAVRRVRHPHRGRDPDPGRAAGARGGLRRAHLRHPHDVRRAPPARAPRSRSTCGCPTPWPAPPR